MDVASVRLRKFGVLLAVSALFAAAGCATAGSGGADRASDQSGPIKIGYLAPLSGGSASLGVPAKNGMELAIEQINADKKLDRQLQLVAVDDQADASKSAAAAQKMVGDESIVAVIGGPNSGVVKANNPIITGAGVPNLISVAQVDALVDSGGPSFGLTFRVSENNSYDVNAITSLFKDGHYQHICAVADTTEYGQSGIATIKSVFGKQGLKLSTVVQHEVNATDLTPQVLTLRNAKCDAVYLFDLGQDAALFMKTVNQLNWHVPVVGARGLAQPAFLSIAGATGDGIVFPSVIDPNKQAAKDYIAAYDKKFGADDDPAHVFSAIGYDTVQVLAKALVTSGGKGGKELVKALEGTSVDGVTGRQGATLGFAADRHEAPSANYLTFWTIKNGKYALYRDDVTSGQA
jgi:branched-chain amino acid transport system substrate-binding protein